jgi:type I restriction enzyme S subunit|nr:restriction endonuclease subunit S [uncultured Halomonas sp.]
MSNNWINRKLGDVISLEYGKPLPKDQRCSDKGYPAYGANGVKTYAVKPYWNKPSIIVGRKGTAGAVNLVEGGFWPLDVTYYVTFDSSEYDLKFLFYTLSSFNLPSFATGVKPGINRNLVYAIEQKFPALAEQKRIVAILDEAFDGIDAAIANTEKNLANARELFESYLNSTFLCTRPNWQKIALSEICSIKHGFAFKSKYFTNEGQYIVLTPGSFYESGGFRDQGKKTKFYDADVPEDYLLKKDDLLFAMTEQAAGLLGSSLIVPESDRFLHNQRLGLVKPFDNVDWHNDFFFHQFNTTIFRSAVQSTASGVKVRHTSPGKFGSVEVLIPPYIEQVEIASKLNYLWSQTYKLANIAKQKISSLNELKRSILHKAFTGELTANNVVEITTQKQPKTPIETSSPEFAAHIMAAAYHWHASQSREKTFGRVKAQKMLHLVESLANIDLGRQPIKDAAGPNDFQHMQRAEEWARDSGFFEFVKRPTGQRGYDFRKGACYGELVAEAMQALMPYENVLKHVVKVLMPLNTAETEILATVYAAWNNLLLEGIEPTENAIIHEARENWHADKLKYSEEQFRNAISQLRQHGLVPQGRGKRVTGQESLAL